MADLEGEFRGSISKAESGPTDLIFADDFETGTTDNWSLVQPPWAFCEGKIDGTDCGVCRSCQAGICAPNSADHFDCSPCEACSDGACVVQLAGDDLKDECAAVNCTDYLFGWSPLDSGTCTTFAASTSLNGACDGAGQCETSVPEMCQGSGAVTWACSFGCRKSCPIGSPAISYDSANEVCFTDSSRHSCPYPEDICDSSGTCIWTGSCPVLFTEDGTGHAFEADIYPSGKLGLLITGGFRKPYPHDNYLLRHVAQAQDGVLDLRIVEERQETNYLDKVRLYTVDVPENRTVVAEILSVLPTENVPPEELLHTVAIDMANPVKMIRLDTGADITTLLTASDKRVVELNHDNNLFEWKTIEINLGYLSPPPQLKLVIDARLVFPSTAEGYALARDLDPTNLRTRLEVQDGDGSWEVVPHDQMVLTRPKEFSRLHVMDITGIFISNSRKLRLSYLYHTFIDSIRFDITPDLPVAVAEVDFLSAYLEFHGPDARSDSSQIYEFVYGVPDFDRPIVMMPGSYTRYGEVTDLVQTVDDMFVIFGIGDQVRLLFEDPGAAPEGMNRRFLLYSNGYYKTYKVPISHTVDPLPFEAMTIFPYDESVENYPDDLQHQQYLQEWNTRFVAPPVSDEGNKSREGLPGREH